MSSTLILTSPQSWHLSTLCFVMAIGSYFPPLPICLRCVVSVHSAICCPKNCCAAGMRAGLYHSTYACCFSPTCLLPLEATSACCPAKARCTALCLLHYRHRPPFLCCPPHVHALAFYLLGHSLLRNCRLRLQSPPFATHDPPCLSHHCDECPRHCLFR